MKKFLRHYFTPHVHNNFRAKLLHNTTLFLITVSVLLAGVSSTLIHRSHPDILGISYSISAEELVAITNRYRAEHNLPPLTLNLQLTQAAQGKAADMYSKNYWAHFAPDGSTSPWSFISSAGYNYLYAGENLAKGFTNSEEVVRAWMNSPTHRENMLSSNYKEIGFAIVPGVLQGEDTVLVVEMFGTTGTSVFAAQDGVSTELAAETQTVPAEQPEVTTPPVPAEEAKLAQAPPQQKQVEVAPVPVKAALPSTEVVTKPLIDIASLSSNMTIVIFSIILLAFVLDLIIIERKKIPRFVGHNFDHIIVITLFLLVILLQSTGGIL